MFCLNSAKVYSPGAGSLMKNRAVRGLLDRDGDPAVADSDRLVVRGGSFGV